MNTITRLLLPSVLLALTAAQVPPAWGAYQVGEKKYKVSTLDKSDQNMFVYYPANASATEKFPLISYAHGMLSGAFGPIEYLGVLYRTLFPQLASYGFIVAAPAGCNMGCNDRVNAPYTDCAGLPPVSPDGWASYYGEQLKTVDWAQNQSKKLDPIFTAVDWSAGVGISGHSMGGQATTLSAHTECAKRWGIKAAVLHHSANGDTSIGNLGVNVSVPLAAFGSSGDPSCTKETRDIWENAPVHPKVFRDEVGYEHEEPMCGPGCAPPACTYSTGSIPCPFKHNPYTGFFTAAWFKVYLNGDTGFWHDLVYNKANPHSLCNYANMTECILDEGSNMLV